jgi:hypothetical protein
MTHSATSPHSNCKHGLLLTILAITLLTSSSLPLNPSTVTWEKVYNFDKSNVFMIEFYAKGNELMRTMNINTYYQSDGDNFDVKVMMKGNVTETVIDKKNEVAIQIFDAAGPTPMYNAGGFKFPAPEDLKKLELVPTDVTKDILGFSCKKYTYTYKKIFGEVWLTDQVTLPNDIGVFRATKMAALHNTLSVPGFVMEMTTEDEKGGKTLMKTVSLQNDEKYTIDFNSIEMTVAVNKVNYYTF